MHNDKDCKFGNFSNKTAARLFYEKAKREQQEGRFFPEGIIGVIRYWSKR